MKRGEDEREVRDGVSHNCRVTIWSELGDCPVTSSLVWCSSRRSYDGLGEGENGGTGDQGREYGKGGKGLVTRYGDSHSQCSVSVGPHAGDVSRPLFLSPPHRLACIPTTLPASLDSFLFFLLRSRLFVFAFLSSFLSLTRHLPLHKYPGQKNESEILYARIHSLLSSSLAHIFIRLYLSIHRRTSVTFYVQNPATVQSLDHLPPPTPTLHPICSRHDGPSNQLPISAAR
jgi:hypothetical protein